MITITYLYYNLLDDIKTRVKIEDVVGEVVSLVRKGPRFWGLCPFNQEKTASFMVDQVKQNAHCFSCGWHGDTVQFAKDYYRLSFLEARNWLAARAGIAIPEFTPETQKVAKEAYQKRQQEKRKIESARHLIKNQYSRLCDLEQAAYRIIRTVKAAEDLDRPEVVAAMKTKEEISYILDLWHEADEPSRLILALDIKGVKL